MVDLQQHGLFGHLSGGVVLLHMEGQGQLGVMFRAVPMLLMHMVRGHGVTRESEIIARAHGLQDVQCSLRVGAHAGVVVHGAEHLRHVHVEARDLHR